MTRRAAIVALLALTSAARAGAPEGDDGGWEAGVTAGFAPFTYPSTRSLRPLAFPTTPPPCPTCISSGGEGVSISVARFVRSAIRISASFDASREPRFALDTRDLTAGAGLGTQMGSLPLFAHLGVELGVARIRGPVDATSFAFRMSIGLDYRFAAHAEAGFDTSYLQLYGDQPAGDASRSIWGVHLGYRWR